MVEEPEHREAAGHPWAAAVTPGSTAIWWRRGCRRVVVYVMCMVCGVLCLASIIFGVRGYWMEDGAAAGYRWYAEPYQLHIWGVSFHSVRGNLEFSVSDTRIDLQSPLPVEEGGGPDHNRQLRQDSPGGFVWWHFTRPAPDDYGTLSIAGFYVDHSAGSNTYRSQDLWLLCVPFWFAALVFGAAPLPIWWFTGRKRWLRRRQGLCLNCGYDLRATAGRCPECGALAEHLGRFTPSA